MQIQFVVSPESHLNLLDTHADIETLSAFQFVHEASYLNGAPQENLLGVYGKTPLGGRLLLVADSADARLTISEWPNHGCLQSLADTLQVPVIELGTAVSLIPVVIPKPWGREIWYTGMEARGRSGVGTLDCSIPLPWLLQVMPQAYSAGNMSELILLKVLDPLADEVYGDLYFEMHERKQEVYVVTHVNRRAWSDGVGGIRFGFSEQVRRKYPSDEAFKEAYRQAVAEYEQVRRQIDEQLDRIKLGVGMEVNEPVPPATLSTWLEQIDPALREREMRLREKMNAFTRVLPLKVGDVVQVPCYTPHSLLHGVRTVEFQTPVYERKILAFAQKVLTQPHWDTDDALKNVLLDACIPPLDEGREMADGLLCQQIVDFDDFTVWRLMALKTCFMPLGKLSSYRIIMAVTGGVSLPGRILSAEQAVLLPARARKDQQLRLEKGAVALIAAPKCNNS